MIPDIDHNEVPVYEDVNKILEHLRRPPITREADATAVVLDICVALLEKVESLEHRLDMLEDDQQ